MAVIRSMCGGHALRSERLALGHAEAVLLVDDREGQVGELDRLLDEGVRAHDDPAARKAHQARARARGGEQLQRRPLLGRGQRAR